MRGPYVTLTPISKSHPFEDRKAKVGNEENPLKIGRAVARLKPNVDNAIFDCKVLSRNHAVLWCNGSEFFLKDTKSSNGTFINNERLAVTGEESGAKQVYTGDIIQLGVEIVENANKVAHGCIYAMVQLFDLEGNSIPTAREVPVSNSSDKMANGFCSSQINNHQLFQLQQFISEANFQEDQRQKKLRELEEMIEFTENALAVTRKAVVDEDRLLTRIETLESQLASCAKGITGDKAKEDLQTFLEDKLKFEMLTRDVIKRAQEERAEAELRLTDIDRSLVCTEEESNRLRQRLQETEARLNALVVLSDEKQAELNALTASLAEMERHLFDEQDRVRVAEERADGLMVDIECEKELPALIRNLVEAVKKEDYSAYEQQLAALADLLRERGVGAPESVPDAPQPVKKEESPPVSITCASCDVLTEKQKATEAELEASLKENLQLKATLRDLETRLAMKEEERTERIEVIPQEQRNVLEPLELVPVTSVSSSPSEEERVVVRVDPLLASVAVFALVPWFAFLLAVLIPLNSRLFAKKLD